LTRVELRLRIKRRKMANPEHLRKLNQGLELWNKWVETQAEFEVFPDLSGLNLKQMNLEKANLGIANLSGVCLENANLKGAMLAAANLREANLRGANLEGAELETANLEKADLEGAELYAAYLKESNLNYTNLVDADLRLANLTWATFEGADFKNCHIGITVFGSTYLKGANHLDQCKHYFRSIIDFETIQQSWPLPLVFLRGCGLPDSYIEYLPSLLIDQPVQFHSCFISYSSSDQSFAEKLYTDLQNNGIRCWFAPEDMKIGENIRTAIDEAIHLQDKLLLILSEASVRSQWVEQEVEKAFERERKDNRSILFPIRIDDAVFILKTGWASFIKNTRHIGDFRRWNDRSGYSKAFDRLIKDLKAR